MTSFFPIPVLRNIAAEGGVRVMVKKIKKIIFTLFLVAFSLTVLVQCKGTAKQEIRNAEIENIEIDQKIVFMWDYVNFAVGYENYGSFIDNKGNKVEYDHSDKKWEGMTREDQLLYLENMEYEESDAKSKIDMSELKEQYSYLYKIDPDAEVTDEYVANDAGQHTLYGIVYREENVPTFVLIRSEGDYIYVNTDPYAKKIAEWWGSEHRMWQWDVQG